MSRSGAPGPTRPLSRWVQTVWSADDFQEKSETQICMWFLLIYQQRQKFKLLLFLKHCVDQVQYNWVVTSWPSNRSEIRTVVPILTFSFQVLIAQEAQHNPLPAVVRRCEHGHQVVVKLDLGHGRPQAGKNIDALTPNCPPKAFPAIKDQFMVCNKWHCM